MLTTVKTLASNPRNNTKSGNHRSEFNKATNTTSFYYHWTAICTVNHSNHTYTTNNGGWNTQSTNRAINSYRQYFSNIGYTETVSIDNIA